LSFIDRYFESRIPEPGEFDDIDREVINSVKASYNGYIDKMLETRIKQASEYILEIARTGNQYINRRAPWDEIKRDHRRAGTTMYIAINIVAILTLTLYPITPGAAQKIWAMIGFEEPIERTRYNRNNIFVVNSGRSIGKLEAPFKKLSQDFLARISIIVEDARKKAQEDRPPHLRF
jgi:methionyl-tRNA synthetase